MRRQRRWLLICRYIGRRDFRFPLILTCGTAHTQYGDCIPLGSIAEPSILARAYPANDGHQ
jgi:hypothetical protein